MTQRPLSAAVRIVIFSQRSPTAFNILKGTPIHQSSHEESDVVYKNTTFSVH